MIDFISAKACITIMWAVGQALTATHWETHISSHPNHPVAIGTLRGSGLCLPQQDTPYKIFVVGISDEGKRSLPSETLTVEWKSPAP